MSLTVQMVGYNRVQNKLRRVARESPRNVDRILGEHSRDLRRELKSTPYPARRAGQRYKRTGNLANRFSANRVRLGEWAIRNSALYAQYVIGENKQAWMHKGRWWTVQDIERRRRKALTQKLTSALTQDFDRG